MASLLNLVVACALICSGVHGDDVCPSNTEDIKTIKDMLSSMKDQLSASYDTAHLLTKIILLESYQRATTLGHVNDRLDNNYTVSNCLKGMLSCPQKENHVVAFSARVSKHLSNIPKSQTIIFGDVVTNLGGAYDPATGVFTCPVEGVYQFQVTLLSRPTTRIENELAVNDEVKMRMYSSGSDAYHGSQGSNTVILQLKAADRVFVRHYQGGYIHCCWSTFTGQLIKATDPIPMK